MKKKTTRRAGAVSQAHKVTAQVATTQAARLENPGDLLFLPVGAVLTLRDRGNELFGRLVSRGRRVEPEVRKNIEKVRHQIDSLDFKAPEWLREQVELTTQRAKNLYGELNIEGTLKEFKVRERVEKIRTRVQGLLR